jgi:hypothetical protein
MVEGEQPSFIEKNSGRFPRTNGWVMRSSPVTGRSPLSSPLRGLPTALKAVGITSERKAQVTLERFGSEELLKPHAGGPVPFGRSTFPLDPGGEDYVEKNSCDDVGQTDV